MRIKIIASNAAGKIRWIKSNPASLRIKDRKSKSTTPGSADLLSSNPERKIDQTP